MRAGEGERDRERGTPSRGPRVWVAQREKHGRGESAEREKGSEWEEEEGCACNVQVRRADVGLAVFVASARPAAPFSLSLPPTESYAAERERARGGGGRIDDDVKNSVER